MEPEFWHERWRENNIGFHEGIPNAYLSAHFSQLELPQGSRVFVPLAGKSVDLAWLEEQGYRVVAIELDETAVRAFFNEIDVTTLVTDMGSLARYQSGNIEFYAGDFFDLSHEILGPVDAIYDRAALVALPEPMRLRYATQLRSLTDCAPQLLVSFDYDQSQTAGPPFSVDRIAIESMYGEYYRKTLLAESEITGRLAGRCSGMEQCWLLNPRT